MRCHYNSKILIKSKFKQSAQEKSFEETLKTCFEKAKESFKRCSACQVGVTAGTGYNEEGTLAPRRLIFLILAIVLCRNGTQQSAETGHACPASFQSRKSKRSGDFCRYCGYEMCGKS